ncbi:MAG: flagellar biosynthetic protein [Ramlibacter sp.]|jgi:uncharacterized lipoprotein YajG|nr:flagellar biosynthetic protein [Ramlibacter sp.]
MNIRTFGAAALLLASAILGGCATSRSEVRIAPPDAAAAAAVTKPRAVVIRSVQDTRQFAEKPADPSVPSLGEGGASQASDSVKARAIARKRNTYGQALGDVLLQEGQTVTGLVRENLSAAFRQAGYRVATDAASAGPNPLNVDVSVRKFWAWFTPGFWTITLTANIETELRISDGGVPVVVSVVTKDDLMAAGESAWVETVQKALVAYRANAARQLSAPPF